MFGALDTAFGALDPFGTLDTFGTLNTSWALVALDTIENADTLSGTPDALVTFHENNHVHRCKGRFHLGTQNRQNSAKVVEKCIVSVYSSSKIDLSNLMINRQ